MNTTTKQCQCGASFEDHEFDDMCPACTLKREQKWAAERKKKVAEMREEGRRAMLNCVQSMTPCRLRTPDLAHPDFNPTLWQKVRAWCPTTQHPWLGLIGPTGTCKTRCAYLSLRQFADQCADQWDGEGRAPWELNAVAITGMEFNRWCVERFSKEIGEVRSVGVSKSPADNAAHNLRRARTATRLIFDEMGKVRPTPGTIDELFALIDYRHANNLVTIWTSNREPQVFCTGWPEEYADPAVGRILECSTIIYA